MMHIFKQDITFSEVPDEICLTFFLSGCPNNCPDCFWSEYNNLDNSPMKPYALSLKDLHDTLNTISDAVTCVCFLGGEWIENLSDYLKMAQNFGLKTCLYTGNDEDIFQDNNIIDNLDYIKIGRWIESLGGLDEEETTNQSLINLRTKETIKGKQFKWN